MLQHQRQPVSRGRSRSSPATAPRRAAPRASRGRRLDRLQRDQRRHARVAARLQPPQHARHDPERALRPDQQRRQVVSRRCPSRARPSASRRCRPPAPPPIPATRWPGGPVTQRPRAAGVAGHGSADRARVARGEVETRVEAGRPGRRLLQRRQGHARAHLHQRRARSRPARSIAQPRQRHDDLAPARRRARRRRPVRCCRPGDHRHSGRGAGDDDLGHLGDLSPAAPPGAPARRSGRSSRSRTGRSTTGRRARGRRPRPPAGRREGLVLVHNM